MVYPKSIWVGLGGHAHSLDPECTGHQLETGFRFLGGMGAPASQDISVSIIWLHKPLYIDAAYLV